MADILNFPIKPEQPIAVTLTGSQWLALILKLAGRGHDEIEVTAAEISMMDQLKKAGR